MVFKETNRHFAPRQRASYGLLYRQKDMTDITSCICFTKYIYFSNYVRISRLWRDRSILRRFDHRRSTRAHSCALLSWMGSHFPKPVHRSGKFLYDINYVPFRCSTLKDIKLQSEPRSYKIIFE